MRSSVRKTRSRRSVRSSLKASTASCSHRSLRPAGTRSLREAKTANIPVILVDRQIETSDPNLYLSAVTSDQVLEGRTAGDWLVKTVGNPRLPRRRAAGDSGIEPGDRSEERFRRSHR